MGMDEHPQYHVTSSFHVLSLFFPHRPLTVHSGPLAQRTTKVWLVDQNAFVVHLDRKHVSDALTRMLQGYHEAHFRKSSEWCVLLSSRSDFVGKRGFHVVDEVCCQHFVLCHKSPRNLDSLSRMNIFFFKSLVYYSG